MCVISVRRGRIANEIIPVSVEHSKTKDDDEEKYTVEHAIDLNLGSRSSTTIGSDGKIWLKVTLGKTSCIQQVIKYMSDGTHYRTWTCTSSDCSTCEGPKCSDYLLTTSVERTSSDSLPFVADCKNGDTVKLQKNTGSYFEVYEIAITGKQGEIRY